MKSKRKTILPSDLFQALGDMELEEFIPELKESLEGMIITRFAYLFIYLFIYLFLIFLLP